jgi:DNA mismatch endonuclease, patch repair protein
MERLLRRSLPLGRFDAVPAIRSKIMSRIRSKGNRTTEVAFRMVLVRAGIRGWMLHPEFLPARPDFYFPRRRVAIFVDGCFWHGCPKCGHTPRTRTGYWTEKIRLNQERDKAANRALRQLGIRVVRVWEHYLKSGCASWDRRLLRSLVDHRQSRSDRRPWISIKGRTESGHAGSSV